MNPDKEFVELIDQLESHKAPDFIWETIEQELDIQQEVDGLQDCTAPSHIWELIEKDLPAQPHLLWRYRKSFSIAASVLLLISVSIFLRPSSGADMSGLAAAQQDSTEELSIEDNMIADLRKEYAGVSNSNAFKELESELRELDDQKEELLQMIHKYDEESSYGPILTRIENDKSLVMKRMLQLI